MHKYYTLKKIGDYNILEAYDDERKIPKGAKVITAEEYEKLLKGE